MTPQLAAALALITALLLLTAVWLVQLRTRDAGLVDVVWTLAIGTIACLYAAAGDAPIGLHLLLALCVGLWAVRLAGHLALRMRGAPEDRRYAAARAAWGARANLYLLLFLWLQAVVAWLISLPLLVLAYRPDMPATGWLAAGVIIWLVAVSGEAIADFQLARFKRHPANGGQVMDGGLWRYSRHPNYFFETLHWVAYIPLAAGATYGWATLVSPVLVGWLLLKVSGIPTVESPQDNARRAGYDTYVRRTSAFIPWPPARHP